MIGIKAERLVWIFCMIDRHSLDQTLYVLPTEHEQISRTFQLSSRMELGRFPIMLHDEEEWLDFIELTLADWLEQVEGASEKENTLFQWKQGEAWSYRRIAYKKMLEILLIRRGQRMEVAHEVYEAVYSQESEHTRHLHQLITPPMSVAALEAREAFQSQDL
jgi:hypothetical protein